MIQPVAAAPGASTQTDAPYLTAKSNFVQLGMAPPRPVSEAKTWNMRFAVDVNVHGIAPGQTVWMRISQASSGFDYTREQTVEEDGTVYIWYFKSYRTLAEANASVVRHTGPATVEVRTSPEGEPISIELVDWQVVPTTVMSGVTMTRKGTSVRFAGRILDTAGAPVEGIEVDPVRWVGVESTTFPGRRAITDANGQFAISVKPGQRGTLGLMARVWVKDSFGEDLYGLVSSYSRLFTYRP